MTINTCPGGGSSILVFDRFQDASDVPQLDPSIRWHIRVLRYIVENRDCIGGSDSYGVRLRLKRIHGVLGGSPNVSGSGIIVGDFV